MKVRSIHLDDNGAIASVDIRASVEDAAKMPGVLAQIVALTIAEEPQVIPTQPEPAEQHGQGRAPSRPQARAILLGLPDFEAIPGVELGRRYGGSDSFWLYAKERVRVELAALTVEAGKLRTPGGAR